MFIPQIQQYLSRLLDWHNSILLSFGYDPLRCLKCGSSVLVLEVDHKKTARSTILKGHGIWIAPYVLYFLYHRTIVQSKPKLHRQHHGEVTPSLFYYAIFYFQSILYHLFPICEVSLKVKKKLS